MALSLTIAPAGGVTFVQAGTPNHGSPNAAAAMSVASTAGTCLIVTLGNVVGATITSGPPGWVLLKAASQASLARIEIWAYPNNPGGITSTDTFFSSTPTTWSSQISEYSGVGSTGTLDASGTATATSGTTLVTATSGNVTTVGCLAFAAWVQKVGAGPTIFTQPASWTQIANDGPFAPPFALDGEYELGPGTGATLSVTLTSNQTTVSAAGAIVVLRPVTASADQSAYLAYGSVSLKLNTLDFALIDCPTVIAPLSTVTLSDPGNYPDWTGTIAQVKAQNVVAVSSGHQWQTITATNSQAPNLTSAPYKVTDAPAANTADIWNLETGDRFELENGTGHWLLEDSVQEQAYANLSIGVQVGSTNPISLTTIGGLTLYAPAVWPGMTFQLVSSNLAAFVAAGGLYTIQSITITYQGANPPNPVYTVQFGDLVQTLAQWTKAHAV